jgi:hypothetical protein
MEGEDLVLPVQAELTAAIAAGTELGGRLLDADPEWVFILILWYHAGSHGSQLLPFQVSSLQYSSSCPSQAVWMQHCLLNHQVGWEESTQGTSLTGQMTCWCPNSWGNQGALWPLPPCPKPSTYELTWRMGESKAVRWDDKRIKGTGDNLRGGLRGFQNMRLADGQKGTPGRNCFLGLWKVTAPRRLTFLVVFCVAPMWNWFLRGQQCLVKKAHLKKEINLKH